MTRGKWRNWLLGSLVMGLVLAVATGCGGGSPPPAAGSGGAKGGAGGEQFAGNVNKGKEFFVGTCASCHGPDAKGLPGLGKNLITSTWVAEQTDPQLLAFMKVGRSASDPLNTTKVDMPPKGGNPALSEENLKDIVTYVRSINKPK